MEKFYKAVTHSNIMRALKIVTAVFLLFVYSCKSRSSYPQITKSNQFLDNIFRTLGNSVDSSTRLICIYSPNNHLPSAFNTRDFTAMVYLYETKETFYLENRSLKSFKTKIIKESDHLKPFQFIFQNYIDGKIDYLKSLQHQQASDGLESVWEIVDINKKNDKIVAVVLNNLLFLKDGKPLTPGEKMH